MKTVSIKELVKAGASRTIREAEAELVLISKNREPAVWMIGVDALAQAAQTLGGNPELYRSALQVLAVKLFDSGVLSLGRAAELSGLRLTEFMELCGALQVPVYRTPEEGLAAEVTTFDAWLRSARDANE